MSSAAMASSSVSQDDVDNDFVRFSRRTRIRVARARDVRSQQVALSSAAAVCRAGDRLACVEDVDVDALQCGAGATAAVAAAAAVCVCPSLAAAAAGTCALSATAAAASTNTPASGAGVCAAMTPGEQDTSPKPVIRHKDKRLPSRPVHMSKVKPAMRDRRKLREKRRSTGVMHMPSTESTGGSTNDDDESGQCASGGGVASAADMVAISLGAARALDGDSTAVIEPTFHCGSLRNKSLSDLDADDEDNEEGDSLEKSQCVSVTSCQPASTAVAASTDVITATSKSCDEFNKLKEQNELLSQGVSERDRRIAVLEGHLRQMYEEKCSLRSQNDRLCRTLRHLSTSK